MSYDPGDDFGRLCDEAQRAPSIFNNQPWWFERPSPARPECIALWLRAVSGPMNKARAREYVISCGAALFNLRLAIRVAGHDLVVWLLPDPSHADPMDPPTLLARVEIVTERIKKPSTWEQGLYASIGQRHTDRWPYRIVPAPLPIIAEMEDAAAQEGAYLRLLHPREARKWMREAAKVDHRRPPFAPPFPNLVSPAEYGPPSDNPRHPPTRKDFWRGKKRRFEHPQLMALATDDDTTVDWLRAGQALERAILTGACYSVSERYGMTARYHAPYRDGFPARHHLLKNRELARHGLSASFLTQPLEAKDMDGEARGWPCRWRFAELPQMIIRVGYAADRPGDPRQPGPHASGKRSPLEPPPGVRRVHAEEDSSGLEWSQPHVEPPEGAREPVPRPAPVKSVKSKPGNRNSGLR
jgi:hypothetical protein